jgi:hypothetical protein
MPGRSSEVVELRPDVIANHSHQSVAIVSVSAESPPSARVNSVPFRASALAGSGTLLMTAETGEDAVPNRLVEDAQTVLTKIRVHVRET